MSADNGVYILHTRDSHKIVAHETEFGIQYSELNTFGEGIDAYRVAHAQAIDNFDYYESKQPYMLGKYMWDVWSRSPVFYDLEEARDYASVLHRDIGWSEYGICSVDATKYSFT